MKKLILVMFVGMFLCNTSYAASISDLLEKLKGGDEFAKDLTGTIPTIKELLEGKESIKLSCITEKAKSSSYRLYGLKYRDRNSMKGDEYIFEIKEKSFTIDVGDGPWAILSSGPYERKLGIKNVIYDVEGIDTPFIQESTMKITDNYYYYKHFSYAKSKNRFDYSFEKININRYSGKFYFEKQVRPLDSNYVVEGTCTKATEQKF